MSRRAHLGQQPDVVEYALFDPSKLQWLFFALRQSPREVLLQVEQRGQMLKDIIYVLLSPLIRRAERIERWSSVPSDS